MPRLRDTRGGIHYVAPVTEPVEPVDIQLDDDSGPHSVTTEDGTTVTTMEDGTVIIGDAPAPDKVLGSDEFNANLANEIGDGPLGMIAMDLLDGIAADIRTRDAMTSGYIKGIDMLGLKIEDRSGRRTRKNVSTIRHPALLEAIIDFQSAACAELLPAAGPCKVEVAGGLTDDSEQDLAGQLEADMNFYLTTTATEYYPDTDRGFFHLGYGGTLFKKVYNCPLRNRPVSECVYLTDLIVSENATDLDNAIRVTHRIEMTQSAVRRMQLAKVWRDVKLMTPSPVVDQVKQKVKSTGGIAGQTTRAKDQPYTIYECNCELTPSEYGFTEKGAPEDMPLPYRVTLDKDTRIILDMRRAWKEPEEAPVDGEEDQPCLYQKDLPYVMFGMIPGLGFLCLGFLHILGNSTMALTAIWRILVDAGMFSNFPGGVKVKGTRQTTNEIQPGPGEWPEIDTGPMDDIRKALMPLPYKEPSQVFIQFSQMIADAVKQLAGSTKIPVGEGAANIPVGTIMAMIEQETKTMAAVHKRLHSAQAREFQKLRELFTKNPEPLYRTNKKARKWQGEELKDMNLVPSSDPNIPSQMHRIMLATAKVQLAKDNPEIYDLFEAHMQAWETMGVDASSFLHKPAPQAPDPQVQMAQAMLAAKTADTQVKSKALDIKQTQQQREAADRLAKNQQEDKKLKAKQEQDALDRQSKEKIADMAEETERLKIAAQIKDNARDRSHESGLAAATRTHEAETERFGRAHEALTSHLDRINQPKPTKTN